MNLRQSIRLAQKPRSSSVWVSQQQLVDDLSALFAVVNRLVTELDSLNLRRVDVPATSTSPGTLGDFAINTNYVYFCIGTDSWKRLALATF